MLYYLAITNVPLVRQSLIAGCIYKKSKFKIKSFKIITQKKVCLFKQSVGGTYVSKEFRQNDSVDNDSS